MLWEPKVTHASLGAHADAAAFGADPQCHRGGVGFVQIMTGSDTVTTALDIRRIMAPFIAIIGDVLATSAVDPTGFKRASFAPLG